MGYLPWISTFGRGVFPHTPLQDCVAPPGVILAFIQYSPNLPCCKVLQKIVAKPE